MTATTMEAQDQHASSAPEPAVPGPATPRWTHIALPVQDIEASVEWYGRFTPLKLLDKRSDHMGHAAWLGHEDQYDKPFILVLVQMFEDEGKGKMGVLGPFAHIGIEVPEREAVDEMAAQAGEAGCLWWTPREMPPPIGYICALHDPDGNVIEISHGQGVYSKAQEVWGNGHKTS